MPFCMASKVWLGVGGVSLTALLLGAIALCEDRNGATDDSPISPNARYS